MADMPRLLFIDDQPDFLATISFWMRSQNYEVITAKDGQTGIDIVKKGGADIVFCDFKMPGLDGIETIRLIRQINQTIPVILVTAYTDKAAIRDIRELKITAFFPKMGQFTELEQVLEVVIRGLNKSKEEKS